MEGPSKAASEEVVEEEEQSPIDDDQFLQGLSKAASHEVQVVGRIIEGPSKEASREALHHEMEKLARLRYSEFSECISKREFQMSPSRQRLLIIRDEGYKPRIGLWDMLSSDETPGKIMKNISPIIDEIMVNQFIKGLRKEYATDEDVDFDMIIEVLGDIFREMMQVLRNKYPSGWLTISLTSISLRSISRLKGLQKIVWDEIVGKIMEEQLIGWIYVVRKKVYKNIHGKIVKRLRLVVDENMIGPSKEESDNVVHKIIEELRPSLDNIMKESPLKEAFSLAIEWIRKEQEPIVRLPSKEVSDKLISIVREIISEIDSKIAVGCLGVSNELTAILGKLAEQTKKVTKELIVYLVYLDMNLEGVPRKVIDRRRDIERCVVLLVPDCRDKRKYIEETKRKLKLKEEEQEMKEKQKSKEELVYEAIRKIANSPKESNDKCEQIIKSINVRDNKSCKTVKYADRGDKKASKKDRRKKMKSIRKKGLYDVHFESTSTLTLKVVLPTTLEAPQALNVDPILEASLDDIHLGSTSTSTLTFYSPFSRALMESYKIICKASLGKELRKVTFPGSSIPTYGVLRSMLASLFHLTDFRLQYKDEDGDSVILSSEEELHDALYHLAAAGTQEDTIILRLYLDEETPKVDNELREVPQNSIKTQENAAANEDASEKEEVLTLNKVVNNIQGMMESIVSHIGTSLEKEISNGLANLGIVESEPSVTTLDSHNAGQETTSRHPTFTKRMGNHADTAIDNAVTPPSSDSGRTSQASSDISSVGSSNDMPALISDVETVSTTEPDCRQFSVHGATTDDSFATRESTISSDISNSASSNALLKTRSSSDDVVVTSNTSSHDAAMTINAFSNDTIGTAGISSNDVRITNISTDDAAVTSGSSGFSSVSAGSVASVSEVSITAPQGSTGTSTSMHRAICNICELMIVGTRYKCINCPDFDLCNKCFERSTTEHPMHTFMAVHNAGFPGIRAPHTSHHTGIRCDGCRQRIQGVRYKCGNCPDFDLCGNCEASPFNNHDPNHVFIKINRAVTAKIPLSVSLLPSFYLDSEKVSGRPNSCCTRRRSTRVPTQDNQARAISSNTQENAQMQTETPVKASLEISSETSFESSSEIFSETSVEASSEISSETSLEAFSEMSSEASMETHSTDNHSVPSVPKARFVEDVNNPDGTSMAPQMEFQKIWKMYNTGDVSWPESTILQFTGGHSMFRDDINRSGDDAYFPVGAVEPGKHINVCADLRAPAEPGRYISYWRLVDGNGFRFGHRLWCDVIVEASNETSASLMMLDESDYGVLSTSVQSSDRAADISMVAATHPSDIDRSQPSDEFAQFAQREYERAPSPSNTPYVLFDTTENNEGSVPGSPVLSSVPSVSNNNHQGDDTLFAEHLEILRSMGFEDREFNIQLLLAEDGNVQNVVDALLADRENTTQP